MRVRLIRQSVVYIKNVKFDCWAVIWDVTTSANFSHQHTAQRFTYFTLCYRNTNRPLVSLTIFVSVGDCINYNCGHIITILDPFKQNKNYLNSHYLVIYLKTGKRFTLKMEKTPSLVISSPNIKYTDDYIFSDYEYEETLVTRNGDELTVRMCMLLHN